VQRTWRYDRSRSLNAIRNFGRTGPPKETYQTSFFRKKRACPTRTPKYDFGPAHCHLDVPAAHVFEQV
jgi:hypothetical protein